MWSVACEIDAITISAPWSPTSYVCAPLTTSSHDSPAFREKKTETSEPSRSSVRPTLPVATIRPVAAGDEKTRPIRLVEKPCRCSRHFCASAASQSSELGGRIACTGGGAVLGYSRVLGIHRRYCVSPAQPTVVLRHRSRRGGGGWGQTQRTPGRNLPCVAVVEGNDGFNLGLAIRVDVDLVFFVRDQHAVHAVHLQHTRAQFAIRQ